MSKVKFIVATGANMDIENSTFRRNPIPVLLNYDYSKPPIAMATLSKEGNKIFAEADIPEEYLFGTPGVGGSTDNEAMRIYDIGIFLGPNKDESIKSIAEQINQIPAVEGELIEYKLPQDR